MSMEMLAKLRELQQQIADLTARVAKLEAPPKPDRQTLTLKDRK